MSGLSVTAESVTTTTVGTETNTIASTEALDGVYHTYEDSGGVIDFYYQGDVFSTCTAESILWNGHIQGNGDTVSFFGWDWVAAAWVQIGTHEGSAGVDPIEKSLPLTIDMTGTSGSDKGKVRLRLESTEATLIGTDRILFQAAALATQGIGNQFKELLAGAVTGAAAVAGTLTTTEMTTDLTETTDDHFIGRTIIWITGNLLKQASDTTGYTGSSKKLTFTAVTEAPAAGDSFILV